MSVFTENPITKIAFILITFNHIASGFYAEFESQKITAVVFVICFITLILRAEMLGQIGKTLAEALKEKWSK